MGSVPCSQRVRVASAMRRSGSVQPSTTKLTASTAMPMRAAGIGLNTRTNSSTPHTSSTVRNHPAATLRGVKPNSRIYAASLAPASSANATPKPQNNAASALGSGLFARKCTPASTAMSSSWMRSSSQNPSTAKAEASGAVRPGPPMAAVHSANCRAKNRLYSAHKAPVAMPQVNRGRRL